jgi:phage/plasmid-associated DNA primase
MLYVDKDIYEQKSEEEKKSFGIKDFEMGKKLVTPQELSGLLNKALEGLIRFYKNKKFSYSKGTDEVSKEWIMLSDSFMAFCLEFIELADNTASSIADTEITRKDLASQYHKYCVNNKVKGVGDKGVRATLNAQFGVYTEGYTTTYGTNERSWQGIRWKPPQPPKTDEEKSLEKTSQVSQPFTPLCSILEIKKKYIETCETCEKTAKISDLCEKTSLTTPKTDEEIAKESILSNNKSKRQGMKIKLLKDIWTNKAGDIISTTEDFALRLIKNGEAVSLEVPNLSNIQTNSPTDTSVQKTIAFVEPVKLIESPIVIDDSDNEPEDLDVDVEEVLVDGDDYE